MGMGLGPVPRVWAWRGGGEVPRVWAWREVAKCPGLLHSAETCEPAKFRSFEIFDGRKQRGAVRG